MRWQGKLWKLHTSSLNVATCLASITEMAMAMPLVEMMMSMLGKMTMTLVYCVRLKIESWLEGSMEGRGNGVGKTDRYKLSNICFAFQLSQNGTISICTVSCAIIFRVQQLMGRKLLMQIYTWISWYCDAEHKNARSGIVMMTMQWWCCCYQPNSAEDRRIWDRFDQLTNPLWRIWDLVLST